MASISRSLIVARASSKEGWDQIYGDLSASLGPKDRVLLIAGDGVAPKQVPSWLTVSVDPSDLVDTILQSAAAASAETIILLSPGVSGRGHWLSLLAADLRCLPRLAVVGPRSPSADAGQWVYLTSPELLSRRDFRAQLSRGWEKGYQGMLTREGALTGACLAIRASDFEELCAANSSEPSLGAVDSGWSALVELILENSWNSGGLYVSHASLVYSYGPIYTAKVFGAIADSDVAFPLLSASLIVKDEELDIERCLLSLKGIADEIVVYDTGSTDRTVEIAESCGASVIRGYWDDDFGAARNRALKHCRGRWVIWVDADEVVSADPERLREFLADPSLLSEMLRVKIRNFVGTVISKSVTHTAMRVFRRTEGAFTGALHERVVRRATVPGLHPVPATGDCSELVLDHYGYLKETVEAKEKVTRNTNLAMKNHHVDTECDAIIQQARTHMMAGELDQAIELIEANFDKFATQFHQLTAITVIFQALLVRGRHEEAEGWLGTLEEFDTSQLKLISYRAQLAQARGNWAQAIELYNLLPEFQIADDGVEISRGYHATDMALCYSSIGDNRRAAITLLENMRERGTLDLHVGVLVELMQTGGVPMEELGSAIPAENEQYFYAQFLQIPTERAEVALDGLYLSGTLAQSGLLVASMVAAKAGTGRALEWSIRLRNVGLSSFCPLLTIARGTDHPPSVRVEAAAICAAAFSDPSAESLVAELLVDLAADEEVRSKVQTYAPHLLSLA